MKQNLLTHIMRLTILSLLFFGVGTGSAVAGMGLECRDVKPTISHEEASVGAVSNAAIIAQGLTDWGIPSSRFTQFKSDLATAGDDLINFFADKGKDGLKAWEVLDDAGAVAMKTDVGWLTTVDNWTQVGYPANQISKAVNEIASNPTLKAAFEADEVVFDAWKWIDDGIPSLPQGQPSTYVNYLKRKTIYLNQATQGGDPVKYYRVQQAGPNGPEEILSLDGNGNVTFGSSSNDWLNFSTDNIDHARYFKDIDPTNRYIIEYEMPKSFDDAMKGDAIPQWGAPNNVDYSGGVTPQIADPNQPGHPFTTRQWDAYWKSEFQLNVIAGSGKIVQ